MHVQVTLYGAARVVIGQPVVELAFDPDAVTLAQVLAALVTAYPRVRPYLLDEAGTLPANMRVLLNGERPDPDMTLATVLHNGDRIAFLFPIAGGAAPLQQP
jgi:molybdopterin converting factor small subunit